MPETLALHCALAFTFATGSIFALKWWDARCELRGVRAARDRLLRENRELAEHNAMLAQIYNATLGAPCACHHADRKRSRK